MPLFGAHMSISKGLHLAFDRLEEVGGAALQIFTANQRQWNPRVPADPEIEAFRARCSENPECPVASHDSYLINLASPKSETETKSINTFASELQRCAVLGIGYVVMHPGAHLGEGISAGVKRLSRNLDQAIHQSGVGSEVMVLLETTAGQGSSIGSSFEELAAIIKSSAFPERLGICYDTCHTFAAGYDIRSRSSYEKTMDQFDRHLGLERLKFFHLNDSLKDLGSRVDRHAHIGQGKIGVEGFRNLVNDPRFAKHPMVLETPKSDDLHEDRENLDLLANLVK